MSPFENWMSICLSPIVLQFEFNEDFTRDMPCYTAAHLSVGLYFLCVAEAAIFGASGLVLWGIGKCLAKLIRKTQRPKYYPQERMRRRRLAKERRSIRKRFTLNKIPTAEMLNEQWQRVRKSHKNMLIFGSMLCDLEAYVDNSLIRDEYGEIIGRNPGIRGWLATNCPQLFAKYKTVMKYKTMAEKFRQAIGLSDPYPATMVLECNENLVRNEEKKANDSCENTVRNSFVDKVKIGHNTEIAKAKETAKALLEEIRNGCEMETGNNKSEKGSTKKYRITQRSLVAVLETRLRPESVPLEIEIQERRQQGLPSHDGPLRKFAEMMA